MYTGEFNQPVKKLFTEDELQAKINRSILGLEVRITLDQVMNYKEAKLYYNDLNYVLKMD